MDGESQAPEPLPEVARPSLELTDASGPSKQVAGFSLDIAKDGGDIALTWTEQAEGTTYEVWTSSNASFAPGDEGAEQLAGGLASAAYVHEAGNDATSRYYRVRAEGDPQLVSTTVGKVATTLEPGYTKLGLCLLSEVDTAEELFAEMESPVISAHMWSAQLQDWVWTPSATPFDFPLGIGEVVSVHHKADEPVEPSTYTMVGHVPVHGDVRLELLPGDNLVTLVSSRGDLHRASDVLAAVEHATRIGRWGATTQTTHWYPDEGDFEVSPCMPLHVEVSEPSTWPPVGYRRVIGPAGGTIEAYDGAVVLDIPPGALSEDVEIRITPYAYTLGENVVPTLAFEPHDIAFAVPVTLTKRYRSQAVAPRAIDEFAELTRYSTDGTVALLDTLNDIEAGTLTASLETFSYIDTAEPCDLSDPVSMTLAASTISVEVGQTGAFTAELRDGAGDIMAPLASWDDVTWVPTNPLIATITSTGIATADVAGLAPGVTAVNVGFGTCRIFRDDVTAAEINIEPFNLGAVAVVDVPSCAELTAPGGQCNDNDACTTDVCNSGVCGANSPVSCNDGNACTIDGCNAGTGCTTSPVACNDGNACTYDGCDASTGCVTWPVYCPCLNDFNACLLASFSCGGFYAICAWHCQNQYNACYAGCPC